MTWTRDPNFIRKLILVGPIQVRSLKSIMTLYSTLVLGRWLLVGTWTRTERVLPEGVLLDGVHRSVMQRCLSLVQVPSLCLMLALVALRW